VAPRYGARMQREVVGFFGVLISSWEFLSQYLWQHSPAQFLNAYLVAVLSMGVYAAAFGTPWLVYANAVVAVWLLGSSWLLPRLADATLWNNVLVSLAMLSLAALPCFAQRMRIQL
jgi:hypothetical protein